MLPRNYANISLFVRRGEILNKFANLPACKLYKLALAILCKRLFLYFLILLFIFSSAVCAEISTVDKKVLRVGVLSFRSLDVTEKEWRPTIQYLQKSIPQYQFELVPFYYANFEQTMSSGGLDFLLTNPEHFVLYRTKYGFSSIATLMPSMNGYPTTEFGGVMFTRASQTNINTIDDIKGKKVASPSKESFAGYLLQMLALKKQDISQKDINITYTGMPHDKVVSLVLSGVVDVGFVRTGILEAMIAEHKIQASSIKLINKQKYTGFDLMVSTQLYPEWPFAAKNTLPVEITKKVARVLLEIEPNTIAAVSAHYYGFAPPLDYTDVEIIMQKFRIHPDFNNEFDINDIFEKYSLYLLLIAFVAFIISVLIIVIMVRDKKVIARNILELESKNREIETDELALKELNETLEESVKSETAKRLEKEKLLIQQSKMAMMGEMIGAIAHQWRQPLNSLGLMIQDVSLTYRFGELDERYVEKFEADSMSTIQRMSHTIDDFRNFFKPNKEAIDFKLEQAVGETLQIMSPQLASHSVMVEFSMSGESTMHGYKN